MVVFSRHRCASVTPSWVWSVQPRQRNFLPPETTGASYQAWLGFYNSFLRRLRWDKERLVEEANIFAEEVLALPGPPPLQAKTVGKMGLKGVRGLNVLKGPPGNPPGSGRGGGGGKGRRW